MMAKSFQSGNEFFTHLIFTWALFSFHFSTLEEYYTGTLYLGPGNGVSDGTAFVVGIYVIMGIFGNDWMLKSFIGHITYGEVIFGAVGLLAVFTVILNFKGVLDH